MMWFENNEAEHSTTQIRVLNAFTAKSKFQFGQRIGMVGELNVQKRAYFTVQILGRNTLNRTKDNFGLTADEFENLLSRLRRGDTTLFESVFLKHFRDCVAYLRNRYRAQHDDAYDVTMDTLLEFRHRLVQGKVGYGNMRFLFTQMASQAYIRKMKADKLSVLTEKEQVDEANNYFDEDDLAKLSVAWNQLSPECQKLFKMNFYQGLKLVEVAEQLQRSAENVRKQKERCKKKLIQYFNEQTNAK